MFNDFSFQATPHQNFPAVAGFSAADSKADFASAVATRKNGSAESGHALIELKIVFLSIIFTNFLCLNTLELVKHP
jgi:hypothetical protein